MEEKFYKKDLEAGLPDAYGVLYSQDGKILIDGSKARGSYKVKEGTEIIGYEAFANNYKVEEIFLPESVNEIEPRAFHESYIVKIHFPSRMSKIGFKAFEHTWHLEELTIPEGVEEIEEICPKCFYLRKVTLPSTLRVIGFQSFMGCEYLKEINFPEGLIKIGNNAFYKCINLTSFRLPSTLQEFNNAFVYCPFLREITISKEMKKPFNWRLGVGTPYPKVRYDGETDEELEKRLEELRKKIEEESKNPVFTPDQQAIFLSIMMKTMSRNKTVETLKKESPEVLLLLLRELGKNEELSSLFENIGSKATANILRRILYNCEISTDPDFYLEFEEDDFEKNKIEDKYELTDEELDDFFNTDKSTESSINSDTSHISENGNEILKKFMPDKNNINNFRTPEEEFYERFHYYPVKETPGSGPSFPAYDKDGNLILNI